MKKDAVKEYNAVLDVCRNVPLRKYNIEMELPWISSGRLGTLLTTLVNRKLMTKTPTKEHAMIYEYLSVPNAVYTVLPKVYNHNKTVLATSSGIERVGNVTIVTSNSYKTKGTSEKRSAWIGSSAGLL